jgi:hypothetical protein
MNEPQEWTCKDGVVYFATHKGWPMRYKAHALEVVNAHSAAIKDAIHKAELDEIRWWDHTLAAERRNKDGYGIGYETAKAEYSAQLTAEREKREQAEAMMLDAYDKAKKWREEVKTLVEVLEKVDYFGDALIARNYEPSSPTVKELISAVRVALAKVKENYAKTKKNTTNP